MKKQQLTVLAAILLASVSAVPNAAIAAALKEVTICIFDPLGTNGPAYANTREHMLEARRWGLDAKLKVFPDERVVAEELKAGQCDGAAVTTLRAKQFNKFVGSLDAIGAVPDNQHLKAVLNALVDPKMAHLMVEGQYEIAGIAPLGAAYVMVRDRAINSVETAAGKKVAVFDWDRSQAKMVSQMGAQPVPSDITNFASKFNNGQVDIIAAPAVAFKPLEIYRGMGDKGGVYRFPLAMITASLVIRKDAFPPGVAQQLREFINSKIDIAFEIIAREEKNIDAKYWMDLSAADKVKYVEMMRLARIQITKDGDYHPNMMRLLKRVRCRVKPDAAECSLTDE
ncbi:MAG: DUF6091 family protein [Moraxellaceae bacterium]|nr:DUF6091 family protein [Moraxellaceae bacterium]MDP1776605.1 DUF6091 family protein [Moraxellaceae bacterium]